MPTQRHFGNKLTCQTQRLPTRRPLPQTMFWKFTNDRSCKNERSLLILSVHVSREFGGEGLK